MNVEALRRPLIFPSTPGRPLLRLMVAAALTAMIFVGPASIADPSAGPGDAVTLDSEGEFLHYQRILGELDDADPGPEVRIHADGTVLIRRPAYQSNPGLWRVRLASEDLQHVVDELSTSGLLGTSAEQLEQRRDQLIQERAAAARSAGRSPVLHAVGDADRSVLKVSLADYRPAGTLNAPPSGPITRSWTWDDLHHEATLFPEITELDGFDRLEHLLIDLLDRDSLEKVAP